MQRLIWLCLEQSLKLLDFSCSSLQNMFLNKVSDQGVKTCLTSLYYTPRKLCLWEGILFSRCPNERTTEPTTDRTNESVSVTFCFLNILESH